MKTISSKTKAGIVVLVILILCFLVQALLRVKISDRTTGVHLIYEENILVSSTKIDKEGLIEVDDRVEALRKEINHSYLWKNIASSNKVWEHTSQKKVGCIELMFLENDKIGDIVYLYEDGTVVYNDKVCISSPFKNTGKELYQYVIPYLEEMEPLT
jgi:hypothetical protein